MQMDMMIRSAGSAQLLTPESAMLDPLGSQGSSGDVQGSRPSMLDFKGRAKYDAWAGKKGTSRDDAQRAYVALVNKLAGG